MGDEMRVEWRATSILQVDCVVGDGMDLLLVRLVALRAQLVKVRGHGCNGGIGDVLPVETDRWLAEG